MSKIKLSSVQLNRELLALKQRVLSIEKALRPKPIKAALRQGNADTARRDAERKARHDATMAYYDEQSRDFYRRNPDQLKADRHRERALNEYLKDRGLKPWPSRLPTRSAQN